jgi:hypothetical protein
MTTKQTKLKLPIRMAAAVCALLWLFAVSACDLEHLVSFGHLESSEGHGHDSSAVSHKQPSDSRQSSPTEDDLFHSHDSEDHSHDSHGHGDKGDSCCAKLKASSANARSVFVPKPVFFPMPFLADNRKTGKARIECPLRSKFRQIKQPDFLFTPEVCLGPAIRSLAPPSFR